MLLVVLILPLISINIQQKPQESQWYARPFTLLGSLIQESYYEFSHSVTGTTSMYIDLIGIKKDSQNIKSQNSELLTRLAAMAELKAENDRLRGLLEFKQSSTMQLVAAQVIGRDLVADHNTVTINKGLDHGVKAGMAVLTTTGAVGYVFRPEKLTSHVMLVTDRYSVVDAIVARSRAQGIVEGKSDNTMSLKYVEKTADVKSGDIVVTGGLDNIFPKGFPIAVVDSIEKKAYTISLKVDLRPIVDPYKLEEVFVVTKSTNEDFTSRFVPEVATSETGVTSPESTETTAANAPATATTTTPAPTTTTNTPAPAAPAPKPATAVAPAVKPAKPTGATQ